MSDIDEIANRIADIILSPDSINGLVSGALTVPLDFGYLIYGYLDTGSRYAHDTIRIRMAKAIKRDILNREHIKNAIETIFDDFNKYLSEEEQNKIYRTVVTSIAGRLIMNTIVSKIVSLVIARVSFISSKSSYKSIAFLSTILLIGGMSERSIRTSEALAVECPEIYYLLRPKDYDLLYFLIEPAVKPFIDAIQVRATQGEPAFHKIIELAGKKINGNR